MTDSPLPDHSRKTYPRTRKLRKARQLSPNEALLYLRPGGRSQARRVNEELLLSSKRIERIPTEGISLEGETFWCPDLQPYVTDPKRGAVRKSFLILYDPADLANRRLQEIRLYEVDGAGRRTFLLVVPHRRMVREGYSNGQFIRELDRHQRITESKVAKARDVYADLMLGRAAREKLAEDQAARAGGGRKLRDTKRVEPATSAVRPAFPEDSAFRKALEERDDSPANPPRPHAPGVDARGDDHAAGDPSPESGLSALFGTSSEFEEPLHEDE
jgi:hypothetical protein